MSETMNRADRETLVKIARQRERVAKSKSKERAARLMADFEKQLDRRYHYDENEVWKEAESIMERTLEEANARIAAECERLGIPAKFAPHLSSYWSDRGRNSLKQERAEMRRVAQREIDAMEKAAQTAIARQSVQTQERILIGGLSSDDARAFLEAMPTAEALMPELTIDRIETVLLEDKKE